MTLAALVAQPFRAARAAGILTTRKRALAERA